MIEGTSRSPYVEGSNRARPTEAIHPDETVWDFIHRCGNEGKLVYKDGEIYKAYDFRGRGNWMDTPEKIGSIVNGYVTYATRFNGRYYTTPVHRMVYAIHNGGDVFKPGLQINHKNGLKQDNRIGNLELVTSKQNIRHAWRTGLRCSETHGNSKLNWGKVREIREKYAAGTYTQKQLSKEYGVIQGTISKVVLQQAWKEGIYNE